MIIQLGIIFLFLGIGELVVWLTGVPIPSSIIGMVLLTASLRLGIVKPASVQKLSDFLVKNLGFFFVPAGVGLMNCIGIIADQWLPIIAASVGSTYVIIFVTGRTHRFVRRLLSGHHDNRPSDVQVAEEVLEESVELEKIND